MTLIIGHRGAPREAPENTLSALRRALELELDGIEYDLQPTHDGDAVLLHDETLERTTDGKGRVDERRLSELFGLDAGSWFGVRFLGEPIPTFEEAWNLEGTPGSTPLHLIELKDPHLLPAVSRVLGFREHQPFLILSFHKAVCLEARDMGFETMYLADVASEEARRFVRDERLAAFGVGPGGWRAPGVDPQADWPCQRWSWAIDDPEELLWAFRLPLFGLNTNEPQRALALRELVRLAPNYTGPPPLEVSDLVVTGAGLAVAPADAEPPSRKAVLEPWTAAWCGDWRPKGTLTNPFPFSVEVVLEALPRGGAFELAGEVLGQNLLLDAGQRLEFELHVVGGSRSPGPDPRLVAHFTWEDQGLDFDVTLARRRELHLGEGAARLTMLRESPGEPPASVVCSRRGRDLVFRVEDPGGLADPRLVVRLGGETLRGRAHLGLHLSPAMLDAARDAGLPFALAFFGRRDGAPHLYRFGGGLPPGLFSGSPGRLVLV